ncbi:hypothetical protein CMI37_37385 [Candidatus Pacearchaeota archaeon]|nr:hypothetical protein [Candidatus Pacearchaeota archaeon]
MASAVGFEDSSGLPVEEVVEEEDFSEFEDIQRALAQESGQPLDNETEDTDQEEQQVESLIDNGLDSADLEADALGTDDEPESPKKRAKGNRADKRIQNLVKERKQLEQELRQRDQYYHQHLSAMQQEIAAQKAGDSKAMQEQLELQKRQLEYLQMQSDSKGELTPMEEYRMNIIKEASEQAGDKFSPEVAALREELEGLKTARQEESERTQRQQRYNYYNQQTQAARDGILLKGFAPDRAKQLAEPMDEMLLAFCGAFGVEPDKAAPQFKKYLDLYVQGALENRARGGGQKIRKGRAVPKSAPSGKRSAKQGNKFPKPDVLRKAGFDSAFDWIAAGEPIIT